MRAPRIAVVGGGLAGLAAAQRLRARGAEVRVLEAGPRLGGRAAGEERDGFALAPAAPWVGARDASLLSAVGEAGLAGTLLPLRPAALVRVGEAGATLLDPSAHLAGGPPRDVGLAARLRLRRLDRLARRFAGLLDPATPERAARLDDRSAADFTRLYFGRRALERWVGPWLAAESLADAEQASRALFLLTWRARDRAGAGTLRGGIAPLVAALADPALDRCGAAVRAVEPRDGGGLRVRLDDGDLDAEAVVVATPAPEARALAAPCLRTPERRYLEGVGYAAAVALAAGLSRAPLRACTRLWVPPPGDAVLARIHVEPASGPEAGATVSVLASEAWSRSHLAAPDDAVAKALLAALERLVPSGPGAVRTHAVWRFAAGLPRFDVGHLRAVARFREVQRDLRGGGRRLYFAGDHLVGPTLEGAAASGRRAADQVAADLRL